MKPTKYVSDAAVTIAREWEGRFLRLPPTAGVLFVAIDPVPVEGGVSRSFEVRLGVGRETDLDMGRALIKSLLSEELESGMYEIRGRVYRGVAWSP